MSTVQQYIYILLYNCSSSSEVLSSSLQIFSQRVYHIYTKLMVKERNLTTDEEEAINCSPQTQILKDFNLSYILFFVFLFFLKPRIAHKNLDYVPLRTSFSNFLISLLVLEDLRM